MIEALLIHREKMYSIPGYWGRDSRPVERIEKLREYKVKGGIDLVVDETVRVANRRRKGSQGVVRGGGRAVAYGLPGVVRHGHRSSNAREGELVGMVRKLVILEKLSEIPVSQGELRAIKKVVKGNYKGPDYGRSVDRISSKVLEVLNT